MELREPPPGGREVQVLLGLCSPPPRLSLASFPKAAEGRYEVRVGGWPASLPVAGNSRARSAQPCPHYPSSSEAGSGSNSSAGGSSPGLDLQKTALHLPPSEPSSQLVEGEVGTTPAAAAVLALSLSFSLFLLSLSVFKSHYMGFCSFGTSSSFPICPGTSGAVSGMLRTRSVDYRDCTNERIQALLVSGGGIRCLPLPSFYNPVHPPEPGTLKRSPAERRVSLNRSPRG